MRGDLSAFFGALPSANAGNMGDVGCEKAYATGDCGDKTTGEGTRGGCDCERMCVCEVGSAVAVDGISAREITYECFKSGCCAISSFAASS